MCNVWCVCVRLQTSCACVVFVFNLGFRFLAVVLAHAVQCQSFNDRVLLILQNFRAFFSLLTTLVRSNRKCNSPKRLCLFPLTLLERQIRNRKPGIMPVVPCHTRFRLRQNSSKLSKQEAAVAMGVLVLLVLRVDSVFARSSRWVARAPLKNVTRFARNPRASSSSCCFCCSSFKFHKPPVPWSYFIACVVFATTVGSAASTATLTAFSDATIALAVTIGVVHMRAVVFVCFWPDFSCLFVFAVCGRLHYPMGPTVLLPLLSSCLRCGGRTRS